MLTLTEPCTYCVVSVLELVVGATLFSGLIAGHTHILQSRAPLLQFIDLDDDTDTCPFNEQVK